MSRLKLIVLALVLGTYPLAHSLASDASRQEPVTDSAPRYVT